MNESSEPAGVAVDRDVGRQKHPEKIDTDIMPRTHRWLATDEIDRLRAEVEALALLLGECADELETELHCTGRASKRSLDTPHRAKAKLREMGLLTPNAPFSGGRSPSDGTGS
jgi:hypothetical protein